PLFVNFKRYQCTSLSVLTFGIEDAAILTRGTSKAQQSNNNFLNVFIGCFYDIMTANITFSLVYHNIFVYILLKK
ncbi:MAG: hypothetical protein D8H91_02650, partial [Alloprevotella sp.]